MPKVSSFNTFQTPATSSGMIEDEELKFLARQLEENCNSVPQLKRPAAQWQEREWSGKKQAHLYTAVTAQAWLSLVPQPKRHSGRRMVWEETHAFVHSSDSPSLVGWSSGTTDRCTAGNSWLCGLTRCDTHHARTHGHPLLRSAAVGGTQPPMAEHHSRLSFDYWVLEPLCGTSTAGAARRPGSSTATRLTELQPPSTWQRSGRLRWGSALARWL
jgi:hypothetical protein